MIYILFNFYIIVVCLIILHNIRIGFLITFISRIIIPGNVRLELGAISIAIYDVFTLAVLFSFILKREYRLKIPQTIKKYFYIYTVSTFILIFLSSAYVPYNYQLYSFLKNFLFQTIIYIWIGFYLFKEFEQKKIISILCITSLVAGVYGIYSYITSSNPYISLLNLSYDIEHDFSYFLEESRGGLHGRTYGTMNHPLSWGQFWNIFLCLLWFYKRTTNKFLVIAVFLVGVSNIVLCGSRTALVTLCTFFLFILASHSIKKILITLSLTCILFTVIFSIFPSWTKRSDILSYIESGIFFWDSSRSEKSGITGSSKEMRYIQFQKTIDITMRNPIAGVGYNYQYYAQDSNRTIDTDLMGLESIIFKLLIEQGFTGLLIFFYTFNLLRVYYTKKTLLRSNKIILNGYFISFLISILFTGVQGASYTFFMIFLTLINYNTNDSKNNSLLLVKQ